MKIGIVVGSSPLGSESSKLKELLQDNEERFVIAADGGIEFFITENIKPDLWIGDMDSTKYETSDVKKHFPELEISTCSPIKDLTDMAMGLDIIFDKGCDKAYLFGGTGGKRIDHTFANVALLHEWAIKGKEVSLVSQNCLLFVLYSNDKPCQRKLIQSMEDSFISVFSLSDKSAYVSIKGLFYEYEGELFNYKALGVSNQFCGKEAYIEVQNGALLIIQEQ